MVVEAFLANLPAFREWRYLSAAPLDGHLPPRASRETTVQLALEALCGIRAQVHIGRLASNAVGYQSSRTRPACQADVLVSKRKV